MKAFSCPRILVSIKIQLPVVRVSPPCHWSLIYNPPAWVDFSSGTCSFYVLILPIFFLPAICKVPRFHLPIKILLLARILVVVILVPCFSNCCTRSGRCGTCSPGRRPTRYGLRNGCDLKAWRSPSLMKPGLGSGIIILLDGFRPRIKSPIYPNLIQHRWLGSSSEAPNACSNITSLATSVRTAHWKSRWQIREEKKKRY